MADLSEQQFYVGTNTKVENAGVEVDGTARIDGEFHGELKATHLIIGENGFVSGTVSGETAEILGRVEGTVSLTGQLTIRATGLLKGKVNYGSLAVDAGARLIGDLATEETQTSGRSGGASRTSAPAGRTTSSERSDDDIYSSSKKTDDI
ncbi:bactofilin family protein [Amorphus orientalis]|uniref:Cytoskeletal protein CcmA (Bactofilin family) n=1 Tax=Amorphus orientalis TaxID=649198 RepID=A0AAE4AUE2_9HYPH|nr:polymer-forming cytoskeletal protein [Amorphus orientalis]MDQ0317037.1 cytoskeletal protein CcmA (bactofilin family) [Amorphus orientalis]